MKIYAKLLVTLLPLLVHAPSRGESVLWQAESGETKVILVELYTSQGCSSCPPAENMLNDLDGKSVLWKRFVPLALHVDYWNYIGWNDPFAKSQYTERQKRHHYHGNLRAVYTPGWVVDGKEWKGFFQRHRIPFKSQKTVPLRVTLTDNFFLRVEIPGEKTYRHRPVTINVAILGSGYSHRITAGENTGRTMQSNFVTLTLNSRETRSDPPWNIPLPKIKKIKNTPDSKKLALVVWLSTRSNRPIQATGNWIEASLLAQR